MEYLLGHQKKDGYPITLAHDARFQHVYIIGQTGTGKSALLYNLIRADAYARRGHAVLDPHTALVHSLADATDNVHNTIYLQPMADKVVTYDPLLRGTALQKATVASNISSSFKHIWGDSWGPRLEMILRNVIRLLLEEEQLYLKDINRVLDDQPFRNSVLKRSRNRAVVRFWRQIYDRWTDRYRQDSIGAVQNKAAIFEENPYLSDIFGQRGTLDIKDIMDNHKCLLVDIATRMGEDVSAILGSLIVTAIAQAAFERDKLSPDTLAPFFLYVDEFQLVSTQTFAAVLSQARGFRLGCVMAHQYLAQLPTPLKNAVLGNVGTMVCFRVGPPDAEELAPYFGVPPRELATLPNYHAYVRAMVDDQPQTFLIQTVPPSVVTGHRNSVIAYTQERYARPRRQ